MECKGRISNTPRMAAFYRSIDQYGVKYTRYIDDGDSAILKGLLNLNPYDVHVQKLECY